MNVHPGCDLSLLHLHTAVSISSWLPLSLFDNCSACPTGSVCNRLHLHVQYMHTYTCTISAIPMCMFLCVSYRCVCVSMCLCMCTCVCEREKCTLDTVHVQIVNCALYSSLHPHVHVHMTCNKNQVDT